MINFSLVQSTLREWSLEPCGVGPLPLRLGGLACQVALPPNKAREREYEVLHVFKSEGKRERERF